jgi:hypothetical protein
VAGTFSFDAGLAAAAESVVGSPVDVTQSARGGEGSGDDLAQGHAVRSRAAAAQSSSSGLICGGPKGPSLIFTRMATERGLHRQIGAAGALGAGHGDAADADGRRLAEHRGGDGVGLGRRGERAQGERGAALLHGDRHRPRVERAGGEHALRARRPPPRP